MIIRKLNENDLREHEHTGSLSFIYKFSEDDPLEMPEYTLIGALQDDDKSLMANLEVEDFNLSFNGNVIRCAGIGGVCTRPECRRSGAVRQLFDYVYNMYEYDVSLLYPFSNMFYRQLGYTNAGQVVELKMPFADLSFVSRDFDVELYDGSQSDSLYEFHNKNALRTDLTFFRNSNRYFKDKPYEMLQYTYIGKNENGEINGYVTFRCDRPNSTVAVRELAFADRKALFNLLGFLRVYDGNYKTLVIDHLPLWSPVFNILRNTAKDVNRTMRDMGSVRVLNLEKILKLTKYPETEGHFSICSDDPIERNHGIFDVTFKNGIAEIDRRTEGEYDIRLDAAALSALVLCGFDGDFDELSCCQGVEIVNENPDILRVFRRKRVYFTDDF